MIYTTKCTGRDTLYERMSERKAILDKQKEPNMTNKTTEQKPKITLEHGKTYVTKGGKHVNMKQRTTPVAFAEDYKFTGSNGMDYRVSGDFYPVWNTQYKDHIIISEYKETNVQPKLYTAKEVISAMSESYNNGKSYGRIFSTSELQSLTKMQSKVITALEAEILELKETAAYLGNCVGLVNRVNTLRKQIFNEITTKKKRLVKLVELQSRMKRSK